MITEFEITQEDIEDGIRADCDLCPGARAINRKLKDNYYSQVVCCEFCIVDKINLQTAHCSDTPENLQDWVEDFDKLGPTFVQPIKFILNIPEQYLKAA